MNKLSQALTSRTVWTIIVTLGFSVSNTYAHYLSPEAATLVTGILSALAVYFKISPSQPYGTPPV